MAARCRCAGALLLLACRNEQARPRLASNAPRSLTSRPPRRCLQNRRSCFALADQKEGMSAFVQKRKPVFTDK